MIEILTGENPHLLFYSSRAKGRGAANQSAAPALIITT